MNTVPAFQSAYPFVMDMALRILVVDDDPVHCEFASVHLTTPNTEIVTVLDGNSALAALEAEHFDLVLLDYELPDIDGIGVLRRIRADEVTRDVPVIMVTSHEDIVTIDAAFDAGATSFVTKPVNWRLLSYQILYVYRAQMGMKAA